MRTGLRSNASEIARRMATRPSAIVRELTREAPLIALMVHAEAKRQLQEGIYNVPIPAKAYLMPLVGGKRKRKEIRKSDSRLGKTTKGKLGRWERSGNLKRSEGQKALGTTILLTNNANYAIHRYRLGTPGGRRIKSPGVRVCRWQWQAVVAKRSEILRRRRQAVMRGLSRR